MTTSLATVGEALHGAGRRGRDVTIVDAVHDSRQAAPGALFCAIPGQLADGHDHAPDAVARGAAALLVERWLDLDVPQLRVPSVRAAVGPASAVIHGHPSRDLAVVGVTGTNGKTTVAALLEGAFGAAARGTGVIGTIATRIHGARLPGVRTTPEGTDLQRLLRTMHTRGVDAVAMEVSSHGLDLRRVDGVSFTVAVYTNLSQDHLDWHGSMTAYYHAKRRLFVEDLADRAVVHLDGDWGRRLAAESRIPTTTVGRDTDADVRLLEESHDVTGSRGRLVGVTASSGEVDLEVRTGLAGRFNLENAATAVTAAVEAGVDAEVARDGVAAAPGVPGRLERVEVPGGVTAFVDYAHTPDAVTQVVAVLRELVVAGRIVIVLGCGGERDTGKRAPMGAAAVTADVAVLTSDNPRGEDPAAILAAVESGARAALADGAEADLVVEPDRRAAIRTALAAARPGDVVVVAGKGHETVQVIGDERRPFDDRRVLGEIARELDGGRR